MSWEAAAWAMKYGDAGPGQKFDGVQLTGPEKSVLILLADHYNQDERCAWPSIQRLAARTALNRTTVMRALDGLETKRFIERERWIEAHNFERLNARYYLPAYDPLSHRRGRYVYVSGVQNDWIIEEATDEEPPTERAASDELWAAPF